MELRRTQLLPPIADLEPCSFCPPPAARPGLSELRHFDGLHARVAHQVTCRCGAAGPERSEPALAVAAWNGRWRGAGRSGAPSPAPTRDR